MTTLKSTESNRTLTVYKRNDREVDLTLRADNSGDLRVIFVEGPALRDALLEAFPLEEEAEPVVKPKAEPGTVWRSNIGHTYITLPNDKAYVVSGCFGESGTFLPWKGIPANATIVFDPREAKALPSPLGIRVGDKVRRVVDEEGVVRTTEFEVHIITTDGYLYSKYEGPFRAPGYEVISREVPDRLPAGTIVRRKSGTSRFLRTADGWICLSTGMTFSGSEKLDPVIDKDKSIEVIYLP